MTPPANLSALLTDLYQLTMAAAYHREGMKGLATFSLFVRDYPPDRGYFVSAGLADLLDFLEGFRFSADEIDHLRSLGGFPADFLEHLAGLTFSGTVRALPEGTVFFKDEPIVEVTAAIIEAQLVETMAVNLVNLPVSIATKAARCVQAAGGRDLVDFSLRRTQGPDAGMTAARSARIAGFAGTSNVLAGRRYGIPVSGTMAHSFVTAFPREIDAFRAFARAFPDGTVLLIDTYDTVAGAEKAVTVAREMASAGHRLGGVRLDSGDMAALSRAVRRVLDEGGFPEVRIFASGGFDEFEIARVIEAGARIDAFGVGTKMGVSADGPYLDIAYKLVVYDGRPVLKLSSGKKNLAGEKQVFRTADGGRPRRDTIALRGETPGGAPLLETVMRGGRRRAPDPPLERVRDRFRDQLAALPDACKALVGPRPLPVDLTPGLEALQRRVTAEIEAREAGE